MRRILLLAALLLVLPPRLRAQEQLYLGLDSDTRIAGLAGADHQVYQTNLSGTWILALTGMTAALPSHVAIDALDVVSVTEVYFSLDCNVYLGGTLYADEDVVRWNGAFSLAWQGTANGLPASADLDALDIIATSPLQFSFSLDSDAVLTIGGGPQVVADEDVIHYTQGSGLTALDFDGSARGVPTALNLDAFDRRSAGEWIMSFDGAGKIGSLTFDDADLLLWNTGSSSFTGLYFNAAGQGVAASADLAAAQILAAGTPLPTATPTASPSPTNTATPAPTASPTASATPTETATDTPTSTPPTTPTATGTETPTATPSPTETQTGSPTATPTTTGTPGPSGTPSPSPTDNASRDWELYE